MTIVSAKKAYEYAKANFPVFPKSWYISNNFTWNEVFTNELKAYQIPPFEIFENAVHAAQEFQKVRDFLGLAMDVHCWFRSKAHNLLLKAQGYRPAMHSSHLWAFAIDFSVRGMPDDKVREKLMQGVKSGKLKIRIEAKTKGWVHADVGNPYLNDYRWGTFNP